MCSTVIQRTARLKCNSTRDKIAVNHPNKRAICVLQSLAHFISVIVPCPPLCVEKGSYTAQFEHIIVLKPERSTQSWWRLLNTTYLIYYRPLGRSLPNLSITTPEVRNQGLSIGESSRLWIHKSCYCFSTTEQ